MKNKYYDLIGVLRTSESFGEYKVVEIVENSTQVKLWLFKIVFEDTKNEYYEKWDKIRKNKVKDLKLIKQQKAEKTRKKIINRNKLIKKKIPQNYVRKKEHECILVLDIATYKTGYTIILDDFIDCSGVVTSDNECMYKRVVEQTNQLRKNLLGYKLDAVVAEGVYLGLNSKILTMLSEFRGMYQGIIKQRFYKIAINSWKQHHDIIGSREEQKATSIKIAEKYLGREVSGDDEADSVCMALWIINQNKY